MDIISNIKTYYLSFNLTYDHNMLCYYLIKLNKMKYNKYIILNKAYLIRNVGQNIPVIRITPDIKQHRIS